MKVALYCRCSTESQDTDNQRLQLEAFCEERSYEIVDIYSENESAWRSGHQRELSRLLDTVRSGRKHYDIVLVWALDRVSREGIAVLMGWINAFSHYKVKVLSLKELSLTEMPSEFQPLFIAWMGFMAKWESDRRSARIKAGIERKVAKEGFRPGRRPGSKDKHKRNNGGYLLRYHKQTSAKNEHEDLALTDENK
jgi:putative DNA-invertase from lambdoid prophage Rac